ncbi:hypothetical protein RB595_010593 [Gaeumannomyces hyphopodioides]
MAALLTAGNLVLLAAAYLAYKAVAQVVRYRYLSPLAQFPGPFWGSVTRLWIAYHNVRGSEPRVFRELHRRHGPVVRVTPTLLSVADATRLPDVYWRHAHKSQHYITGSFGRTESLFNMQDAKTHARFRKIAAAPYSFSNVRRMEPLLDATIGRWMDKLQTRFAGTGEAFDFAPWAVYMAYDIISEVGFGQPFGFIEQERDVGGLIQGFHDGLVAFGVMARCWPFTNWVKSTFLGKYLVASPEQDSGIGRLMRFRDRLIAERVEANEKGTAGGRVDLLQTFLEARDEEGKPLDLEYVRAEVLLVLMAGADTTGTTVNALVTHLMAHPAAYAKVTAEIDAAGRDGKLSATPQHDEVAAHCPYYVACVRETMRLNPAAPNIFPRLAGPGGIELYGKHAPEGTELTCNPWLVHRDPAVYGDDADEFRPERWLEDEARTREMLKYSMAFGYGPRECLGRHIAMMELFKGPLQFLRHFRVEALDRARPGKYVYKGGISYFEEVMIKIERRV